MHMILRWMLAATLAAGSHPSVFAQEGFRLSGTAPETLNGATIHLSILDYSSNKYLPKDSTQIADGHFVFTGHLSRPAMLATLFVTKPRFAGAQFYLENRPITVTIHPTTASNQLDSCTFTNAPVQDQYLLLKAKLKTVDSLTLEQYKKMDTAMAKADQAGKDRMNKELTALFGESKKATVEFIKENPDSYMSLYQLCYMIGGGSIRYADSLQNLLAHLSKKLQQEPEALALAERIQKTKAGLAGQSVRWIALPDEQNKPLSLTAYKGKYVLLDFWASWCGPCIQNLPAVKELYTQYNSTNFDIVGISLDEDRTRWTEAIKKHNLPWAQVSDLKGWKNAVADLYDIRSIPQYILVGPDGKIIANSNDIEPVKQQLEKVMKQKVTLK